MEIEIRDIKKGVFLRQVERIFNEVSKLGDIKETLYLLERLPPTTDLRVLMKIMIAHRVATIYAFAEPLLKVYNVEIKRPEIKGELSLGEAIEMLKPLLEKIYMLMKSLKLLPKNYGHESPAETLRKAKSVYH